MNSSVLSDAYELTAVKQKEMEQVIDCQRRRVAHR